MTSRTACQPSKRDRKVEIIFFFFSFSFFSVFVKGTDTSVGDAWAGGDRRRPQKRTSNDDGEPEKAPQEQEEQLRSTFVDALGRGRKLSSSSTSPSFFVFVSVFVSFERTSCSQLSNQASAPSKALFTSREFGSPPSPSSCFIFFFPAFNVCFKSSVSTFIVAQHAVSLFLQPQSLLFIRKQRPKQWELRV